MLFIDAPDRADAVDRGLVVEVAHQRVARVGRYRTDAAVIEDESRIEVVGVSEGEVLLFDLA